ncbi:hypothetical protein HK099_002988, partial [Clydaea vesicula]
MRSTKTKSSKEMKTLHTTFIGEDRYNKEKTNPGLTPVSELMFFCKGFGRSKPTTQKQRIINEKSLQLDSKLNIIDHNEQRNTESLP